MKPVIAITPAGKPQYAQAIERADGIPLVGYTFWPLFSLFAWGYQRGGREIVEYKLDMGLYDLVHSASGWERALGRAKQWEEAPR